MLLCTLAAAPAARALDAAQLRSALAAQSRHLSATSGAEVRDLETGATLYARRATTARSPASNEKLLVTSTALLRYGPRARLRTALVAAAEPVDGVIAGDVVLVGAGDPYLTSARLRVIASQLSALGVEEIRGKVLGDGSAFDARRGSYDSAWAYDGDLGGSLGALVTDHGRGTDPALYAATQLRQALLNADIVVRKGAHSGRSVPDAVPLAGVSSDPLATMVTRINVPSDNFAAEMLLKALGASFGARGSTPQGAAIVRDTLAELGVSARLYDGSGLSRADQVSPHELVDLLAAMAAEPDAGPALRASLPVAGRSGTLAGRMRRSSAAGRCRAKTGTLRGVSALSGYCDTTGGPVAFSFVENNMSEYKAKQVEDRMTSLVARYTGTAR